jgi:hypothetical protein
MSESDVVLLSRDELRVVGDIKPERTPTTPTSQWRVENASGEKCGWGRHGGVCSPLDNHTNVERVGPNSHTQRPHQRRTLALFLVRGPP